MLHMTTVNCAPHAMCVCPHVCVGDGSVKIWSLSSASCVSTLSEHTSCVWDVSFHHSADFLVSASMDHTLKCYDVHTGRCRQTYRGHVDSVNSVVFQPYSNLFASVSGDKTVSVWDIRTNICIQTLYGHANAIISNSFSVRGDEILSTDADGQTKIWDIRLVSERASIDRKSLSSTNSSNNSSNNIVSANDAVFDKSGSIIAVAYDDARIALYSSVTCELISELSGHEDSVQSLLFDNLNSNYLISGSSDTTFRIWS